MSTIRQVRGAAEFEVLAGRENRVFHGHAWTVLYETDPAFLPSPLGRTVRVKPIKDIMDVAEHLRPWQAVLQAVGVAAAPKRLRPVAEALSALGVIRICPIGRMQSPPLGWHGEAGLRLLDLIR